MPSKIPTWFQCDIHKIHWSNKEKAVEDFKNVVFQFFQKINDKHRYAKEQTSLVIMGIFKIKVTRFWKKLFVKIFYEIVIVPQNLTNKFIDISVNKSAKYFF